MATTQLDLFGEIEASEEAERSTAQARLAERQRWGSRFQRAAWTAPWDCADGTKKGTVRQGWRCPDEECSQVEPTTYTLRLNHGFDPEVPGQQPWDGRCFRLRLLRTQAQSRAATST